MKNLGFSCIALGILTLCLAGCESSGRELSWNITSSPAKDTINEITTLLGDSGTIKDVEYLRGKGIKGDETLDGYSLTREGLSLSDINNSKLTNYFDGWVQFFVGDSIGENYVEYINNNVICSIRDTINADSDEFYNLLYNEENYNNEDEKQFDEIINKSTYTSVITCADFTDDIQSPLNFHFQASGEEPFWDAEIITDNVEFNTADGLQSNAIVSNFYKKNGVLTIKTNDYNDDLNLTYEFTQKECIDGGKGDTHEYSVKVSDSEATFEGCADKLDSFLVNNRQGTLSNFIKETGYKYNGEWDTSLLHYSLSVKGNLINMDIYIGDENIPEDNRYLTFILGITDDGLETYRMGEGYNIDNETCEKFVNIEGLMDFGVFTQCPRG